MSLTQKIIFVGITLAIVSSGGSIIVALVAPALVFDVLNKPEKKIETCVKQTIKTPYGDTLTVPCGKDI